RCLDWRPWVLEILKPKKRTLDLKQIQREINGSRKVRVKGLRKAGKAEVRQVKQLQPDKSYRVLVETEGEINEKILQRLKRLKNIQQRTPLRVAKRRADLVRRRKVKELRWKLISKRRFELVLRAEAGLYIKELVTGDEGRTNPSVSGLLGMKAKPLKLDVIKIWL
ncbi:MAG: tRNA pseudouridine(54/55) synthase Pus10, partial [Candidatus Aenigmatarchaeota archaeon]